MGSEIKASQESELAERLEKIENKLDLISGKSSVYGLDASGMRSDEIDLRELWGIVWGGKWIIIATTFIFAIASVFYALSLPDIYKSEALLAPTEENAGGGLAGLAGQFGGLASLAGVNLESSGGDKIALTIEVLKSRNFITKFIESRKLLVPVMAAKSWNGERLVIDANIYDEQGGEWVRSVSLPRKAKPSAQEVYKEFMEIFNVNQDKDSGFVSISIEFYSPVLARKWVDWLIEDINNEIKERDVAEAQKSIQYLNGQLEKTPIADMQAIFYELIEEQSKTVMFAEVRDEYVFKTIDEAISPELKSNPKRALICILGIVLGVILAIFYTFISYFFKKIWV